MPTKFWTEEDVCEVCGGPAVVVMKQDFTHGEVPLRPMAQRVQCLMGCLGQVLPAERVINRGA